MARLHWNQIGAGHLSYYHLDLAYSELQPDLFRHAFPACLKLWYDVLMGTKKNNCEFHYALLPGQIPGMLRDQERQSLNSFFADGLLDPSRASYVSNVQWQYTNCWVVPNGVS